MVAATLNAPTAHAQPLARFVLPTNTTETAVQPTFRIITSLPIDATSVHWNKAYVDSIHRVLPILCVVPRIMYDSCGDSVWQFAARRGTGIVINDTTIEFQTVSL